MLLSLFGLATHTYWHFTGHLRHNQKLVLRQISLSWFIRRKTINLLWHHKCEIFIMVEFKFKVQHFTFNIALRLEHRINPISKLIRNSSIFLEYLFLKTLKFKVNMKEMFRIKVSNFKLYGSYSFWFSICQVRCVVV